jgi:hypothetical protein
MTTDDQSSVPTEPTGPEFLPPPSPAAPEPAAPPPAGSPHLGHVVLGAILVLIGVGWLLEALDVADVPWRFLLPAALIIVGVALVFGARTGSHGGLVTTGVALTVLVLLAGAIEVLVDVPFTGGVGDETYRPTTMVDDEYRLGVGKLTVDLRDAEALAGREIEASVILGELLVIVPPDVPLVVAAQSGVGEVVVLGQQSGGLTVQLHCRGLVGDLVCDEGAVPSEPHLRLNLEVAVGKVEVQP